MDWADSSNLQYARYEVSPIILPQEFNIDQDIKLQELLRKNNEIKSAAQIFPVKDAEVR